MFALNKRERIILTSAVLSLALLVTWFLPLFFIMHKSIFMITLAVVTYVLSLFSIWEGINRLKAFILMILPTSFVLVITNYYFLLPSRWLSIPLDILFAGVFYTLLLCLNIFNVSSIRTIPLYRVALTTVFVLTLFTCLMLFNVIFSQNMFFIWNGIFVFLLTFPLVLQVLWAVRMEKVDSRVLINALVISLVASEIAIALSFWQMRDPIIAVIILDVVFMALGICLDALRERMTRGEVLSYLGVGSFIFILALLVNSWLG